MKCFQIGIFIFKGEKFLNFLERARKCSEKKSLDNLRAIIKMKIQKKKVPETKALWLHKDLFKSKILSFQKNESNSNTRQVRYRIFWALSPNFASHEMF